MNATPTALAAVVVVVLGVASGAAIGGKTQTRTVTVVATAAPVPAASPAEPSAVAAPKPTPGFQRVPLDDELVTIDDTTSSSLDNDQPATLVGAQYGVPAQLQQGSEKDASLTFDFGSTFGDFAADYYQFEITVPEGATRLVSEMGFLKGEATGNRVKVAFYENQYDDGALLRQREIDSASETAPVDIVATGASKIIVRLTCRNSGRVWKTPGDDDPSFGFLGAHFE